MKKLIYILLLGIAVFTAKPVIAQGINNNSDFHVPVQVPTIPPAPTVATIAPAVAAPEVTISPVTTVANTSLLPTAIDVPAMPAVPPQVIATNNTVAAPATAPAAAPAATNTAAAPAAANNTTTTAPGGVTAAAPTVNAINVTQPIPTLPPVPPLPPIPELQLNF